MFPSDLVNSSSPSKVPAVAHVPDGNIKVQVPALGAEIVAVIVEVRATVPKFLPPKA